MSVYQGKVSVCIGPTLSGARQHLLSVVGQVCEFSRLFKIIKCFSFLLASSSSILGSSPCVTSKNKPGPSGLSVRDVFLHVCKQPLAVTSNTGKPC